MPKNTFILIPLLILFVQCNTPTKNNSIVKETNESKDSCCVKDLVHSSTTLSTTSEITCPKCKHKKTETMPTDVCLLSYTCESCKTVLHPKDGDCCVYCTYGTHKCPSKQGD